MHSNLTTIHVDVRAGSAVILLVYTTQFCRLQSIHENIRVYRRDLVEFFLFFTQISWNYGKKGAHITSDWLTFEPHVNSHPNVIISELLNEVR